MLWAESLREYFSPLAFWNKQMIFSLRKRCSSHIFIFYVLHIWAILVMQGPGPLQLILNSICFLLGKILLLCSRKMMSLFSMMPLQIDCSISRIFCDTPCQCFDNISYFSNHDLLKLHWRICSARRPLRVSEIVQIFWKVFWIKIVLLY